MNQRISNLLLIGCACSAVLAGQGRAKNVILFIGDAGGLSTLNAASIHGYSAPQKLFVQRMPHIGLSDTSASNAWVTDSAAAMSAIVTGLKTTNGTLSQTPEGAPSKTILEYAEQRGLSTGVISNVNMADATPAACYSHVDSRKKFGEIFSQVWVPRFGDGVDFVFGGGRTKILDSMKELKLDMEARLTASGRPVFPSVAEVPADAKKAVVLVDGDDFQVAEATEKAIHLLSRNSKGYFLMVEWDLHPTKPEQMLGQAVAFDKLIERTVKELASKDTLVIFAADHSFDLRLRGGKKDKALLLPENAKESAAATPATKFDVAVGTAHTGEEVLVAANGPGADRVRGFMPNTAIFQVMMSAFGWKER
jgi:alkaline phosphatase